MFKKKDSEKNIVKFYASDKYTEEVTLKPIPASEVIPDSYRDMNQYYPDNKIKIINGQVNATAKKCAPMLDAITSGYVFRLYADVLVQNEENYKNISWKIRERTPADAHVIKQSEGLNRPTGTNNQAFKWHNWWIMKTPPGWSTLFIHPLAYSNLPFHSISAVVDTDVYKEEIAFPFWIDEKFEGIIEKGTPIIQAIPFKRSSWVSEFGILEENERIFAKEKSSLGIIKNNYSKNIRQNKGYK